MSLMSTYMKARLNERLDELGWNSPGRKMKLLYSLEGEPGDGICFTGMLSTSSLMALYERSSGEVPLVGASRVHRLRYIQRQRQLFDLLRAFRLPDIVLSKKHRHYGPDAVKAGISVGDFSRFADDVADHCFARPHVLPDDIAGCTKWAAKDWIDWFDGWLRFVEDQHMKTALILKKKSDGMLDNTPPF